jgi:trans-2,3-dihydro-3-hydroxyanthranilate isomerase
MTPRRYAILDVFTGTPLTGNPLAVVQDADDLTTAQMQAIAREFNLSETVFLRPPGAPDRRADLRIFTPGVEMPFAGHPTLGAAIYLGLTGEAGAFRLGVPAGPIDCLVRESGPRLGEARFVSPGAPRSFGPGPDAAACAAALGLAAEEIGLAGHAPSLFGVALPMTFAPVASLEALARIRVDAAALAAATDPRHHALTAYTRAGPGVWRMRMFAPDVGVPEDPATGSMAAAFMGVLARFEGLADGRHEALLHQGVEMGRPSRIAVDFTVSAGESGPAGIAGEAVIVAEGVLHV